MDGPHCIFGQLILRKIINIVANRGQILRLKYTPAGGAYSAPSHLLAGFKGVYMGRERIEREGREGKERGGEGKGGKEV